MRYQQTRQTDWSVHTSFWMYMYVLLTISLCRDNAHPRRPKMIAGSIVQGDRSKEVELGAACEQLLALYMYRRVRIIRPWAEP